MTPGARALALALVALGMAGALVRRHQRTASSVVEVPAGDRARVVELGSTSCQSCKAMHEEMSLLREECRSSIAVEEIDVWRDEEARRRHGVNVIPTQVLLDPEGREIDRHVGFISRKQIRARLAAHGVECRR